MKYGSVCSGIEAATQAWHHMGWKPSFFSEIDAFPCAVLQHHYPKVPLHGDFTTIQDGDYEPINLLVGGTPCQSFSVAGRRKGLDDPRGNLMLGYLAVAKRLKPEWIVWENVPGALSTNGGDDFASFLDGLEELGYIVDVDILDAQFFGVAQRRRRIFVCGQHRDFLLNQMTDSSALTIAQCITEILHSILVNQFPEFAKEAGNSDWPHLSEDGRQRRMKLFGLHGASESFGMFQSNLAAANQRCRQEASIWADRAGEYAVGCTAEDLLMVLRLEALSLPTDESLKKGLGDLFAVMKLSTTLTATKITTNQEISLFSVALSIAKLIAHLNPSCPTWWSAASSSLTLLQDFTSYARQASSGLFAEPEWFHSGANLITEANAVCFALGHIGVESFGGKIFSIPESLSGNPAPSREAQQEVTGTLSSRTSGGGGLGTDFECAGGLQPVAATIQTTCNDYTRADDFNMVVHGTPINTQMALRGPTTSNSSREGLGLGQEGDPAFTLQAAHSHAVQSGMAVRRLTPIECERLQGFPEQEKSIDLIVHNGAIIECIDHPRNYANAAIKCRKLQGSADLVGESGFSSSVKSAVKDLCVGQASRKKHAVVNVEINYVAGTLQIHRYPSELMFSAEIAEPSQSDPRAIQIEDFAQLSAELISCVGQILRGGKAGSQSGTCNSTKPKNGVRQKKKQESGLMGCVKDATSERCPASEVITLTTSQDTSTIKTSDLSLRTLLSCASHAIDGFTPSAIQKTNFCTIRLTVTDAFTQIPYRNKTADKCPDGPRYKALGNSMAVPCMKYIGERIQQVQEITEKNAKELEA